MKFNWQTLAHFARKQFCKVVCEVDSTVFYAVFAIGDSSGNCFNNCFESQIHGWLAVRLRQDGEPKRKV